MDTNTVIALCAIFSVVIAIVGISRKQRTVSKAKNKAGTPRKSNPALIKTNDAARIGGAPFICDYSTYYLIGVHDIFSGPGGFICCFFFCY